MSKGLYPVVCASFIDILSPKINIQVKEFHHTGTSDKKYTINRSIIHHLQLSKVVFKV